MEHSRMEQSTLVNWRVRWSRSESSSTVETRYTNDSAVSMSSYQPVPTENPSQHSRATQTDQRRRQRFSQSYCLLLVAVPSAIAIALFILILQHKCVSTINIKWPGEHDSDAKTSWPRQSGKCVLPPYPEHGIYIIVYSPAAIPGESLDSLTLTVICLPDYEVLGKETVMTCVDGLWSNPIPKCVRFCKLDKNPSVHYHCLVNGSNEGSRVCNASEPSGTVVRPECNTPNYYSAITLPFMRCINGSWDYVAVCSPAAHCFGKLPASKFAAAAGKIYRFWNDPRDVHAQKSNIEEIKTPDRYQGIDANFQDDIALLFLKTAFDFNPLVSPACITFNPDFYKQLKPGQLGKVAGWGLTGENGPASQVLQVIELPYMDIGHCIAASPPDFRPYITSDKMCAGSGNGKALCKGDSGGGLVFSESERGIDRYTLVGIVSTAPRSGNLCNSNTFTAFTQLLQHEHFIRRYLQVQHPVSR